MLWGLGGSRGKKRLCRPALLLLLPCLSTAGTSPGRLPKACLLGSRGTETVQNSAPSFSSHRCSPSQEDEGTSWKGPARCSCSAGENERKFSAAFHPVFAPSLPGSAGTDAPAEPASSCPDGGLGLPRLCDRDGAGYRGHVFVGCCSNHRVPQDGRGREAKASCPLPPQPRRQCPACEGILPGPLTPDLRVQPAPPLARA